MPDIWITTGFSKTGLIVKPMSSSSEKLTSYTDTQLLARLPRKYLMRDQVLWWKKLKKGLRIGQSLLFLHSCLSCFVMNVCVAVQYGYLLPKKHMESASASAPWFSTSHTKGCGKLTLNARSLELGTVNMLFRGSVTVSLSDFNASLISQRHHPEF